ncbi:MAG: translation initiation factor IF-2 [Candidatus Buchananbacteria bacterium RIFCSPHIGHO2_01_FULL_44_11]|uniref:Translation initiation factor IF-2 n=1 Tax=Candidatus Buchananbacteria bacterium RIFCSPHIGHO2_01_FULL_44_11 TaxID=1797535 RepID=A0A1G1Y1W8_9BACT|nr:MAG: translation initiation factor IF-2 [Candidatus Buchananbacteria bacterium RIFCSPHIGHO2_01_FULL_44_11]
MNVTELARKLKIPSRELLEILPAVGFDIGRRAIKIDNRQAQRIIESWSSLLAQYRAKLNPAAAEELKVEAAAEKKPITLPALIRVRDFAQKLGLPLSKVIAALMKNGVLSAMNEMIDFDTASIIGTELGFEIVADTTQAAETEKATAGKLETLLNQDKEKNLVPRPPVVVVMGHVDHGKTKLLDSIRKTNVVASESGGITQHIGAYQVERNGKPITFIDTPGHEAFSTMRSRGARVADIAILVIAADDSIQPQTKESIKIIHSAGLPMIVAINKIDKPEANQDKVKQDLAALDLLPEEWGGKTICVPISAKAGTGIDELLEMILLVAQTTKTELVANPDRLAVGTVIESHVDRGQGPLATLLIQNGTLRVGDLVMVADNFYGKIRAMKDFSGQDLTVANPSTPARVLGLKAAPSVGDIFEVTAEVDRKSKVTKYKLQEQATGYTQLVEINKEDAKKGIQSLNLVLRADVLGSLEAIISSLNQLSNQDVPVNIIAKGLGNITENDVMRAMSGNAVVFGFHVKVTPEAELVAKEQKVEVKSYDIIYQLLDDVKVRLESLLVPEVIRTDFGRLKVLAIFRKEKNAMVIGGKVTKGVARSGVKAEVLRNKAKISAGDIIQLQLNKISVAEVNEGSECGLKYEGKPVVEVDDILEFYTEEIKKKKLVA